MDKRVNAGRIPGFVNALVGGGRFSVEWLTGILKRDQEPDLPDFMVYFSRFLTREQIAAWAELQDRGWQFHAVRDATSKGPTVIVRPPDDDTLRIFRADGFIDLFTNIEIALPNLELGES